MEKKSFFQSLFGSSVPKENPDLIKSGDYINLQQYDTAGILSQNSVVYLQTQLGFPVENIRVTIPDDDKNRIFEFKDPGGVVYGYYEYLKLDVKSIDMESLIDIYTKDICKNLMFRTVHKTYIDGRNSFIVTGKQKEKLWDEFSLVVIEGSALTMFSIITDENFLFSNPDYAYKIFSTYKFIKNQGLRQRIRKDFICFSANEFWAYWGDSDGGDGYYTYYKNPKDQYSMTIFLCEAFYSSVESMKADFTEAEGEIYQDTLRFKETELLCSGGYTFKNFLHYLVIYKTKKFRFCIRVKNAQGEDSYSRNQLKELGIWNDVIEVIKSAFYFNF